MPERYKEEIEEILRRTDELSSPPPTREAERPPAELAQPAYSVQQPGRHSTRRWPALSPGKILLAGLVLFLLAAVFRKGLLVWAGLGVLVVAYLLFFARPRSISYEKRWRGRPVKERPSAWGWFKRWLGG